MSTIQRRMQNHGKSTYAYAIVQNRQQTDTVLVDVVKYMRRYHYNGKLDRRDLVVICARQYRRAWRKGYIVMCNREK